MAWETECSSKKRKGKEEGKTGELRRESRLRKRETQVKKRTAWFTAPKKQKREQTKKKPVLFPRALAKRR